MCILDFKLDEYRCRSSTVNRRRRWRWWEYLFFYPANMRFGFFFYFKMTRDHNVQNINCNASILFVIILSSARLCLRISNRHFMLFCFCLSKSFLFFLFSFLVPLLLTFVPFDFMWFIQSIFKFLNWDDSTNSQHPILPVFQKTTTSVWIFNPQWELSCYYYSCDCCNTE